MPIPESSFLRPPRHATQRIHPVNRAGGRTTIVSASNTQIKKRNRDLAILFLPSYTSNPPHNKEEISRGIPAGRSLLFAAFVPFNRKLSTEEFHLEGTSSFFDKRPPTLVWGTSYSRCASLFFVCVERGTASVERPSATIAPIDFHGERFLIGVLGKRGSLPVAHCEPHR